MPAPHPLQASPRAAEPTLAPFLLQVLTAAGRRSTLRPGASCSSAHTRRQRPSRRMRVTASEAAATDAAPAAAAVGTAVRQPQPASGSQQVPQAAAPAAPSTSCSAQVPAAARGQQEGAAAAGTQQSSSAPPPSGSSSAQQRTAPGPAARQPGSGRQRPMCVACGSTVPKELGKVSQQPRFKVCGGCRTERYCDQQCQKQHWAVHKHECSGARRQAAVAGAAAAAVASEA